VVNEEHLDFIKKGVTAWNELRELNPDIKSDLVRLISGEKI